MGVYCDEIKIETNGETDIVDITSYIQKVITVLSPTLFSAQRSVKQPQNKILGQIWRGI